MNLIQRLRRWWQIRTGKDDTPFDGEAPFWMLSLAFHLVLLVALATILVDRHQRTSVSVVVPPIQPTDLLEIPPQVQFDFQTQEQIGADSSSGMDQSFSSAPELDDVVNVSENYELNIRDFGELRFDEYIPNPVAMNVETVPVRGSAGEAVSGAAGAIDRITHEILLSLEERKTLVIWMFDQSASLLRQRDEILGRFDKVYDELGMIEASGNEAFKRHQDQPLLTHVFGFGMRLNPMLKEPTDSLSAIKEAVQSIPTDPSGVENVFSSIAAVADAYKQLRRVKRSSGERERNVLIIVISDEAGDDIQQLDQAVQACKMHEIPVFVVGVPSPFGRQETLVKWVDPDPHFDQTPQWTPIRQGPESLFPERIKLHFSGMPEDDLPIDSGFGPFGLTRLCYESGGMYFTVHPNRDTSRTVGAYETDAFAAYIKNFFDPQVMRRYRPDYVAVDTYMQRIQSNKARFALVQASEQSWLTPMTPPQLLFEKFDEAQFVNTVSLAQRAAATLEPKINQLYEILKMGEADRQREVSLRWKAGYDLAMGRVLAVKLRAETYNAMLAMAKTKLSFKDPKNNTWVLEPADEVSTGSQSANLAERAKSYLQRVIQEHPDTPWAHLAQRELATPIGWRWTETFHQPPAPPQPMPQVVNNNANRPMPQPSPAPPPKPRRAPPKL